MVITGPNGGGKTTSGQGHHGPGPRHGGQILWNGQDITKLSHHRAGQAGHQLRLPAAPSL
ncbi:MAG: hypothetical protein ACLUNZ_13890 [Evtepia sp.]